MAHREATAMVGSRPALAAGLRAAAIILLVRGALAGLAGVGFILAGLFIAVTTTHPQSGGAPYPTDLRQGDLMAGAFLVVGTGILAFALASFLFALLIRSRRLWARWVALLGEAALAATLSAFVIRSLWPWDLSATVVIGLVVVGTSVPTAVLLAANLRRG
jgi:hypothetical protein